jgi:hypothetical protein
MVSTQTKAEGIVSKEFDCSSAVATELIAWRAAVGRVSLADIASRIVELGALVRS